MYYYLEITHDSGIPPDYITATDPYSFSEDINDAKMFSDPMPFAMAIIYMSNGDFGHGTTLKQQVLKMPCIDAMVLL